MTAGGRQSGGRDATLVDRVVGLLGWDDWGVVDTWAWGSRRLVACRIDHDEHRRRTAEGLIPVADPLMLKCVAADRPGFLTRHPPVRIAGAIAIRKSWRAAVANLGGFGAYGARIAVLPPAEAGRLEVAAGAAVEGYGVIAADDSAGLRLVHHPDLQPKAPARTWVHRLVEEVLYDAILAGGDQRALMGPSTVHPSRAGIPVVPSQREGRA